MLSVPAVFKPFAKRIMEKVYMNGLDFILKFIKWINKYEQFAL